MQSNATAAELFKHLGAEKSTLYRCIMDVFAAAKRQYRLQLRPDEVLAEANWSEGMPRIEEVNAALTQLTEWGNLESQPDTARVSSLNDFYRARFLYRLSHGGEAVETSLAVFFQTLQRRAELQSVALEDIASRLQALQQLIDDDTPENGLDVTKTHQLLRDLVGVFHDLAENAQAFMAGVARSLELRQAEAHAVVAYKRRLIDYLTKTIPELIGGMISGTSMGGGSAIGGMAAAGAAGAAAAIATIATAGAAAPAAAGALGAAGSGSAAGAGAAGAGGLGGGGLATAINSSFAGGSVPAAAASGGGAASGLGASTGGQAAAKGASSAGARVGGSDAPQTPSAAPQPNSGVQQAAKQAGKSAQGNDDKDQQATPKGGVVSSGNALSQAANGGAKMLGVMASMAVPGMENAHALSLGAGSPPPVPDDTSSAAPANGAESAAEPAQAEANVIRPASDASSTPSRLASLKVPGTASNNDQPEK
ncbi:MAG: TIGR02677 family protein [Burkholderia cenocepacia]